MIDATARIHADAKIANNVSVGAYSIIDAGVEIAEDTWIGPHVVIKGATRIGKANKIFQFCSIGDDPQDKKYQGESDSRLEIGDNNVIREYCSINRGTGGGGGVTRLGANNWIMAYVHIAHDCLIGDHTIFANNATLAGHVLIDSHAILGGFTKVHQFCRVGSYSISAIASVIVKDVPPYLTVAGNTAKPGGLNREGLQRHGFSEQTIKNIRKAYKLIYREDLLLKDAMKKLAPMAKTCKELAYFKDFIEQSSRGIVR